MNDTATYTKQGEPFERDMTYLPDRVLAGASSADPLDEQFPSGSKDSPPRRHRPGRSRPGATASSPRGRAPGRTARSSCASLLGLEDVISWGAPGPVHDARSWTFDLDEGGRDPVLGIERLQEAYFAREAGYPRGITVPAIVDVESGKVVTNDFPQITHDLFFEWREHHRPDAPDLWPADVREEMESVMKRVFTEVNNGVYRCGFAGSQEAYDDAYARLWTAMDWLEERLADRRYLMGEAITEADVRLFTTLARFDAVYHGHFKCNRNKLTEMPNLWGYARDLFQTPGFGDEVDFDQIKQHYYVVHTDINPTQIVPAGPDPAAWLTSHGRG